MKFLAIDFGQRRIGIAVSDPTGTIARGVTTIDRKVTPQYLPHLKEIIEQEAPDKIIFGLPLGPDDEETDTCRAIRRFQQRIYQKLNLTIPFDFQDESYSSVRTHTIMRSTASRKKRAQKGNIDRIAACVILQDYLLANNSSSLLSEDSP